MRVDGIKDLRIVVGVGWLFVLSLLLLFSRYLGRSYGYQNSNFQVQASEQLSLAASEELILLVVGWRNYSEITKKGISALLSTR